MDAHPSRSAIVSLWFPDDHTRALEQLHPSVWYTLSTVVIAAPICLSPLVHLTLHVIKPQSPSLREPAYSKPDLGNAPEFLHLLNYNDVYSCNIPETKPHLDAVHVVLLAPGSYLVQLKHFIGAEASLSSFLTLFTSSNVLKQPRVTFQVNLADAAAA